MLSKCGVVIATLALAAFGGTTAPGGATSGLRGFVTRSPIMPACRVGVPCSAPAKNTQLVFSREGTRVITRTDSAGRYRVALVPGWWNVRKKEPFHIGSGITPNRIRVLAARIRVVDLDIDTGIR